MGGNRSRLRKLTLSVALAASLILALPAFASAARVLYASGHTIDASRLSTFGGHTVVAPGPEGFNGCDDSEWASALARTDYDVLVIGESAPQCFTTDLSATTLTNIGNYLRSGRPVIQTGGHADEDEWMNAVFGLSTANVSDTENAGLTGTLQPSAAGTPFAGGPATLTDPSATELLSGTPGTTIYAGPQGTWVFLTKVGLGKLVYAAWDLCGEAEGGCGNTSSSEDDWYRVIDRAINYATAFTVDGVTRNKKKGTATIKVTVPNSGELTGLGKGVKASSAGGAVISKSVALGQAQLKVKAKGKKKRKLNQKGKVKVKVAITYTPTGGTPQTQSLKVKLKKKLKK
jgi:hypothetical protein